MARKEETSAAMQRRFLIVLSFLKPGISSTKPALGGLAHPAAAFVVVVGGKGPVPAGPCPAALGVIVITAGGAVPAGAHLAAAGVVMGGAAKDALTAGADLMALLVIVVGAAEEAGSAGDLLFHIHYN